MEFKQNCRKGRKKRKYLEGGHILIKKYCGWIDDLCLRNNRYNIIHGWNRQIVDKN